MARLPTKLFALECDGKTGSASRSKYDLLYDAAGFGPGPRLGRLIATFVILPKIRRGGGSARKRRRTRRRTR